jgi:hypothetical protein
MKTNDDDARKVNRPANEAVDSSVQARKVGLRRMVAQVRTSVAGRRVEGLR